MLQTLIGDFHECSAVTSVSLPAFQKVVERRLYIVEIRRGTHPIWHWLSVRACGSSARYRSLLGIYV